MSDLIEIRAPDGLSLTVSTLGAELQSVTAADGQALLWSGDPQWWSGRAPLLFPIVGALNQDAYRLDGVRYCLPRHGFARRREFEVVEAGADHVRLRLTQDPETLAVYPFAFRLDVRYAVAGARLDMSAILANPGDKPLPASFGFHPAFRWPLGLAERTASRIVFDAPEPAPIRRLNAAGLLEHDPLPTPVRGDTLMLDDGLFAHDALIFDRLSSRGLVFGAPGERKLRIAFPQMPNLGVWTKPGAPYLCIEPWQGMADAEGFDGAFEQRPGVVQVAPGAERVFAMSVSVLDPE